MKNRDHWRKDKRKGEQELFKISFRLLFLWNTNKKIQRYIFKI